MAQESATVPAKQSAAPMELAGEAEREAAGRGQPAEDKAQRTAEKERTYLD